VCNEGLAELTGGFLEIARDGEWQQRHPAPGREDFVDKMLLLHRLLSEGGFEFGHRVFFESIRFASMLASAGELNPKIALDHQVIQKILPRLHGSRRRLEPTLCSLGQFCFDLSFEPTPEGDRTTLRFNPLDANHRDPSLPLSFEKIRLMTRNLRANQFTSFTE
jgi:5-methylcytosine-specific restriction protein B